MSDGHKVLGVDNLSFGNRQNINQLLDDKMYTFIELDVRHIHQSDLVRDDIDVVFHLAAYKKAPKNSIDSSDVMINNVDMIKSVIKLINRNNAFLIFTSTSDVYGNSENFLEDESITIGPPNIERYSYAMSKFFDEQLLLNLANENKIRCAITRIFGCFSERSNTGWSGGHVPLFIDRALRDEDIIIHGTGAQTRSMIHVSDIIDGLSKMLINKDDINGEIINLGTDEEMSAFDCAKLIVKMCDSKSKIKFIEGKKVYGDYKEIKRRFANTKKAKRLLSWRCRTRFHDVLKSVIDEKRR